MEVKKILIDFQERRRTIPLAFKACPDDPDEEYEELVSCFEKWSARDKYFQSKSATHSFVFEYLDSSHGYLELNGFTEIHEEQLIRLRLVPLASPEKTASHAARHVEQALQKDSEHDEEYKMLSSLPPSDDSLMELGVAALEEDQPLCFENEGIDQGGDVNQVLQDKTLNKEDLEILQAVSRKGKKPKCSSVANLYQISTIPLPTFSPSTLAILQSDGITTNHLDFISEAAIHLHSLVQNPTPTLYNTYVNALVSTYPKLQFLTGPEESSESTLKSYLTNKMRYIRRVQKKSAEDAMCSPSSSSKSQRVKKRGAIVSMVGQSPARKKKASTETPASSNDQLFMFRQKPYEIKSLMKSVSDNSSVLLQLVQEISDSTSVLSKLKKFPCLSNCDFLLHLFLAKNRSERDELFLLLDKCVKMLSNKYEMSPELEADKLRLFLRCEEDLHPHALKSFPRCITIQEVGSSESVPVMPTQFVSTTPVAISYVTSSGSIRKTFLLACKKVIFWRENLTAQEVVLILLASYHANALSYSIQNKFFLQFLDYVFFNKHHPSKCTKLANLKRCFTEWND